MIILIPSPQPKVLRRNRRSMRREAAQVRAIPTPSETPETTVAPYRRVRAVVGVGCWLYLVFALSLWLFLRLAGDHWWPATLILFGPRWVALLPLALLLPAALIVRKRSVWTLLAGSGIVAFAVMGVRVPWREVISPSAAPTGAAIRVLTCNAHRNLLDTAEFASLIASTRPDVVAMQEWTSAHLAAFPKTDNWNVIRDDELCLFSRYPIRKLADIGAENWKPQGMSGAAAIYELSTPNGPVPFVNLHLASPHRQFDAALHRAPDAGEQVEKNSGVRLRQSQLLAQIAAKLGPATLLSGDFNTPVESDIFGKSWRAFPDAFETAGWGLGHTYFARWTTVRIDHVLSGSNWRCRRCWVAPHVGSPHRPVIAEFEWVGPP